MTAKVNNYTDLQALSALKKDAKANDPKALREAARQFESVFMRMMLKSMRDASPGDSIAGDSQQGDFYQGMFDDQLALHLSQGKGMGLADLLVQQLQRQSQSVPLQQADKQPINLPSTDKAPLPVSKGEGTAIPMPDASKALPLPTNRAPTVPTAANREAFIRTYLPEAQKVGAQLGIDAHSILAQAALETSWGQSLPRDANGNMSNNLFGIKASAHTANAVTSNTIEFEAGVASAKNERFRAYDSTSGSFRDYAALIGNNPRYSAALGTGGDVRAFATALQRGGYATDPDYARKVEAVALQVRDIANGQQFKTDQA